MEYLNLLWSVLGVSIFFIAMWGTIKVIEWTSKFKSDSIGFATWMAYGLFVVLPACASSVLLFLYGLARVFGY